MSRWLQAAISADTPKDKTDITDETPIQAEKRSATNQSGQVVSVLSVSSKRQKAKTSPLLSQNSNPPLNADGFARTWTGRIVNLADWTALSEWERYGPNGRLFYADTWRWQHPHEREGHDT